MNESLLFYFPYCKSNKTNCAYSDFILLLSIHQNVQCCYILSGISDGDMALQGALGSLSLSDLTPHGDLYRERFTTQGGEALIFNILKYVSLQCSKDCSSVLKELEVSCCFQSPVCSVLLRYGQPDPDLERECDIKVSLQMASVHYVHTQRFQAEVAAFIQHFTQLQDVLGRQRAAVEGQLVSAVCQGCRHGKKTT